MKHSDLNHLRRLVGWIRCEIGQTPQELEMTMRDVAQKLGHPDIDAASKERLVLAHDRARAVPKYVRDAVKALEKYLGDTGEVIEMPGSTAKQIQGQMHD